MAQGASEALEAFSRALLCEAPLLARVEIISCEPLAAAQDRTSFRILTSRSAATGFIHLPPDYFLCTDCRAELHDPAGRRYRYPFINCTQCGPRYTVIRALPYDRVNTTLADFALCPACEEEYLDPLNRRFHAEPLACPACGPQLSFDAPRAGRATGHEADQGGRCDTGQRARDRQPAARNLGNPHRRQACAGRSGRRTAAAHLLRLYFSLGHNWIAIILLGRLDQL